eukprot:4602890-Amphidinium_carterae.1
MVGSSNSNHNNNNNNNNNNNKRRRARRDGQVTLIARRSEVVQALVSLELRTLTAAAPEDAKLGRSMYVTVWYGKVERGSRKLQRIAMTGRTAPEERSIVNETLSALQQQDRVAEKRRLLL